MHLPAVPCSWMRGGEKACHNAAICFARGESNDSFTDIPMPILEFHLTEDSYSDQQCEQLLLEASLLEVGAIYESAD